MSELNRTDESDNTENLDQKVEQLQQTELSDQSLSDSAASTTEAQATANTAAEPISEPAVEILDPEQGTPIKNSASKELSRYLPPEKKAFDLLDMVIGSKSDRMSKKKLSTLKQLYTQEVRLDDETAPILAEFIHVYKDEFTGSLNQQLGQLIVHCCYGKDINALQKEFKTTKLSKVYRILVDKYNSSLSRPSFYRYAQTYISNVRIQESNDFTEDEKALYMELGDSKHSLFSMLHAISHQRELFDFAVAESELLNDRTFKKQVSFRDLEKKKSEILAVAKDDTPPEALEIPAQLQGLKPKMLCSHKWLQQREAKAFLASSDWSGVTAEKRDEHKKRSEAQLHKYEDWERSAQEDIDELKARVEAYSDIKTTLMGFIENCESAPIEEGASN